MDEEAVLGKSEQWIMARAGSQTSRVSGGVSVPISLDLNFLDYDLINVPALKGNLLFLLMLQRRDEEVRDARAVTDCCCRRGEAVQQLPRSHVLPRLARGDRTFLFPHPSGCCAVLTLQQSTGAGSTAMLGKALPPYP